MKLANRLRANTAVSSDRIEGRHGQFSPYCLWIQNASRGIPFLPSNSFKRPETSLEELIPQKSARPNAPLPGRIPFGIEVKLAVSVEHGFTDSGLLRPDEGQHTTDPNQGLGEPKLGHHHEEFNHLLYHCKDRHKYQVSGPVSLYLPCSLQE